MEQQIQSVFPLPQIFTTLHSTHHKSLFLTVATCTQLLIFGLLVVGVFLLLVGFIIRVDVSCFVWLFVVMLLFLVRLIGIVNFVDFICRFDITRFSWLLVMVVFLFLLVGFLSVPNFLSGIYVASFAGFLMVVMFLLLVLFIFCKYVFRARTKRDECTPTSSMSRASVGFLW
jgi:hypothetical protein